MRHGAGAISGPPQMKRGGSAITLVGTAFVGAFALSAILAPWLSPYDPGAVPAALSQGMLRPPEGAHPFGTDALGRDLLSRVLHGGRVSLALGLGVEVVAAAQIGRAHV
jgi:peptide/nickel transport system permease protein